VAGRKTFVAGEILTASDVNSFLMDQSVMVFDDSSARGSAIPSPSEGMVTYLKSTDAVEKFTGASFVPIGGLVKTYSATKTDTFSASVTAGNNVAVTGLSLSDVALSNSANKFLITAFFGVAGGGGELGQVGIAVNDGSGFLSVGDSPGSRVAVTAGGGVSGTGANFVVTMPHITILYAPGDTTARTYSVHAFNVRADTSNVFVNRSSGDSNTGTFSRGASALHILEVAV
jgi:hypothetical protein